MISSKCLTLLISNFQQQYNILYPDFYSLVGHTNRPELSGFLGRQKCFPSVNADTLSPMGTVYEVEIEIIYCPGLVFKGQKAPKDLLPKPKFFSESSMASRQL